MTKKKKLKLPGLIYVRWNEDLEDDPFLDVQLAITDHALLHDAVKVGIYKLQVERTVSNRSTVN